MKNSILAWAIAITAGVMVLVLTSVTKSPDIKSSVSEKHTAINLALREIADQLLQKNQDFKTLIPPIKHEGEGSYLIALGIKVDYFRLRSIVDGILDRHHIRPDYRLSLLNCDNGIVELGFLARAEDKNKEVPCQDREQVTECYNIRLSLIQPGDETAANLPSGPAPPLQWLLLGLMIVFPFIWFFRSKSAPTNLEDIVHPESGWIVKSEDTAFHPVNQTLKIKDQTIGLTFREAKLLQFFFDHANQVLERERILQAVWEDEGIIVGRSLDVFVSRLRKKLKADPGIQIVNVHGVGYKVVVG